MKDNRRKFCEEANKFIYDRGYDRNRKYFQEHFNGKTNIFLYVEWFFYGNHPNGKVFKKEITNKIYFKKYKKYMCELIQPIIVKHKIDVDTIV